MTVIPFCGQTYQDKTLNANAQDSINLYPMATPMAQYSDKKVSQSLPENIIMYPTPGYKYQYNVGGAIRAFLVINTVLYIVTGQSFKKFTPSVSGNTDFSTGTFTTLGTLNTNSGICSISTNGVQIVISDGQYGYVCTISSGAFAIIGSSGSFPAVGGVTNFTYFDDYILAGVNNSRDVIQSDVLDATTYGAQAFDTVTSFPDNLVGVFSDELQLYIFGPKLTEVQGDAGSIPYAFQKVSGVLIQAGLAALNSICKVGNTVVFLASDIAGNVYVAALNGYSTDVLSTPPINEAFARYTVTSDAYAYSYREGDNLFYVITFPTVKATWAYDAKMKMWHKRSIAGGTDLPTACIQWQGKHLVGDATGSLYFMSQDYATYSVYTPSAPGSYIDYPMQRTRTAAHINSEGKTLFINELWIDIQSGSGFITDANLDTQDQPIGIEPFTVTPAPLATLQVSRDFGRKWITVGTRSMGAVGQYQKRLIWRNIGRFRQNCTFRLIITDPVQTYIIGAKAQIKVGAK